MITPIVKKTFLISYLILFSTTLITFIESMRTKNTNTRHILNLETAISLIAGYVYYIFLRKIEEPGAKLEDITQYRYIDWFITTPLMLLAIMLLFNFGNRRMIPIFVYIIVLALNFAMLTVGYLGERGMLQRNISCIVGLIMMVGFLSIIWISLVARGSMKLKLIFFVFAFIWSLYGVAYMLDEVKKNVMYNILDVIAKSMFGFVMWLYYGQVLAFI